MFPSPFIFISSWSSRRNDLIQSERWRKCFPHLAFEWEGKWRNSSPSKSRMSELFDEHVKEDCKIFQIDWTYWIQRQIKNSGRLMMYVNEIFMKNQDECEFALWNVDSDPSFFLDFDAKGNAHSWPKKHLVDNATAFKAQLMLSFLLCRLFLSGRNSFSWGD